MNASSLRLALVLIFAAFCVPVIASAHETTRSYLTLTRDGAALTAEFGIAFRDIEVAVGLDADLDGRITWAEAEARLSAASAYALAGIGLDAGGPCALSRTGAEVSANGGTDFLVLRFTGTCPDAGAPLTATPRLFAGIDPAHRLFLTATANGHSTTSVLGTAQGPVTIAQGSGGRFATFAAYLRAGMLHLAGGADHIVFLIVLMLPALTAGDSPRRAALGVVLAASGFTIGHALTLTGATLQLLRPRPDVIELLIALSIIVTAADNIRPFLPAPRALVAGFFGLIHGFGFATVLGGLSLSSGTLALALLGFNIGIELAQVAIILATIPALYMLRAGPAFVRIASAAAIGIGLFWCAVRLPLPI